MHLWVWRFGVSLEQNLLYLAGQVLKSNLDMSVCDRVYRAWEVSTVLSDQCVWVSPGLC